MSPDLDAEAQNSPDINKTSSSLFSCLIQYKRWRQMFICVFFIVAGESAGTLLGRLYFNNGGKSKWLATLVQVVGGFPLLFPFQYWIRTTTKDRTSKPFTLILASIYIAIGVLFAASCMLYSIGLQHLPVTTFTLICASQLGFSVIFCYFLNEQKFTLCAANCLVNLTTSSLLLLFQNEPGDTNKTSKQMYFIGVLCSLGGSAGYALMLSLTQIAFQQIIKKETLGVAIELMIYQSLTATFVIVIGLFASGDWRKLDREMRDYKLGHVSYVMNLFWTSVSWMAFSVGCVGLGFNVSSFFSNVINIMSLTVAPIMAVVYLDDTLTGFKVLAMLLAVWGFVS